MKSGQHNPNWKGGNVTLSCANCSSLFSVIPSRATKAICCSLKCWNVMQVGRPGRPGIKLNTGRRKKWISVECRACPNVFEIVPSKVGLKVFCSTKCHHKWRSAHHSGSRNPNWNGGTRSEHYPADFYAIRESILSRDGHQCAVPMCETSDTRVSVHHIDFNKQNCVPENLIAACPSCNARANFDRELWRVILSAHIRMRMATGAMNIGRRGTIIIHTRSALDNERRNQRLFEQLAAEELNP